MLTNSAIADNIVVNLEAGISAAMGPRDWSVLVVLAQAGIGTYTTNPLQVLRTTNSVAPNGEPLRIRYNKNTDKLEARVQDSTGPRTVLVETADTLDFATNDKILLGVVSWTNASKTLDVYGRVIGGTKRSGTGTGATAFAGVPSPTGLVIAKNGGLDNAFIGSYCIALATGALSSANFDDIYTEFATSPVWGSAKELATLVSAVTSHFGIPITTGSST